MYTESYTVYSLMEEKKILIIRVGKKGPRSGNREARRMGSMFINMTVAIVSVAVHMCQNLTNCTFQ